MLFSVNIAGGMSAELEVMGSMGRASFAGCCISRAACLHTKPQNYPALGQINI